jgi:hypothetical protein
VDASVFTAEAPPNTGAKDMALPTLAAETGAIFTCKATIGNTPQTWTSPFPATVSFPYGSTAVTCTAADAAGNVSPAVSYAVVVVCGSGYSYDSTEKACKGERQRAHAATAGSAGTQRSCAHGECVYW